MSSLFRAPAAFAAIVVVALVSAAGCGSRSEGVAAPPPTTSPTPATPAATTEPPKPGHSTTTKPPPAPSWPTPEDCVSYNANSLTVHFDGAGTYTVDDGSQIVLKVSGQSGDNTGDKALALAQRYTKHCYLGRNNTREEKYAYIFDYWRNASGKNTTIADQEDDCSPYNRNNLTVEDMGDGNGWRVKDHDHVLQLFDNGTDARNGKLVLAKYNQICFIGNGDDQNQISYFL